LFSSLDPERRAKIAGAITKIFERGPALGRPHVDVSHGSGMHKLKEARIDRGHECCSPSTPTRKLSCGSAVTRTAGHPSKAQQAERLDLDHERSIEGGSMAEPRRDRTNHDPRSR
jgi:hypothetical protein